MLVVQLSPIATVLPGRDEVVAVVAALAKVKELVLVVGEPSGGAGCGGTGMFVAQLRAALPRFTISEVVVGAVAAGGGTVRGGDGFAVVAELLNDGGIAVIVTSTVDAPMLVASLAARFGAARLVFTAGNAGISLTPSWLVRRNLHQACVGSGLGEVPGRAG